MPLLTRRDFLRNSAVAAAGIAVLPALGKGWYSLAAAEAPGYFEREFGITDALCRKVLGEALAKGGDFADLFFEHTHPELAHARGRQGEPGLRPGRPRGRHPHRQGRPGGLRLHPAARREADAAGRRDRGHHRQRQAATQPAKALHASSRTGDAYPLDRLLSAVPVDSQGAARPVAQRQVLRPLAARDQGDGPVPRRAEAHPGRHQRRHQGRGPAAAQLPGGDGAWPRRTAGASAPCWNQGGRRSLLLLHARALVDEIAQAAVEPHPRPVRGRGSRRPARCRSCWGPGLTGVLLHEAIGHGMEADFNRKKISTYATMIGRKVAEPAVTIVDDGTLPESSARSTSTTRGRRPSAPCWWTRGSSRATCTTGSRPRTTA